MRKWSKSKAVKAASAAIESYRGQILELESEVGQTTSALNQVVAERREAYQYLASRWVDKGESASLASLNRLVPEIGVAEVVRSVEADHKDRLDRVPAIEADESFQKRDTLLGQRYPSLLADLQSQKQGFDQQLQSYSFSEFLSLIEAQWHLNAAPGGVRGLFDKISGKARRRRKTIETVEAVFPNRDLKDIVAEFEQLTDFKQQVSHEIAKQKLALHQLKELVSEYDTICEQIKNFPTIRAEAVAHAMWAYFNRVDMDSLTRVVPRHLRTEFGRCHALTKKKAYLENLLTYLSKEIQDRENRVRSISSTQMKWQRYPKGSVGNKSKWLVDVPEMKRQGASKRARWVRQSRECFCDYDDYHMYGGMLEYASDHGDPFLAVDAFNHRAEHRMPYEGFTRQVIPELDEHRQVYEQDGPPKERLDQQLQSIEPPQAEPLPMEIEAEVDPEDLDLEGMESLGWEGDATEAGIDDASTADEVATAFADEAGDSFSDMDVS